MRSMKVKGLRFSRLLVLSIVITIALIGCNGNTPTLAQMVATPKIAPSYLDDRSTPVQVIKSYYNAIDTQEYVRAYSYLRNTINWMGN